MTFVRTDDGRGIRFSLIDEFTIEPNPFSEDGDKFRVYGTILIGKPEQPEYPAYLLFKSDKREECVKYIDELFKDVD